MENTKPILRQDGALIPLINGGFAIIDAEDAAKVQGRRWFTNVQGYAISWWLNGQRDLTLMHRLISGAKAGENVDHANHNTLDNRKENLRICNQSQNGRNMKPWAKAKTSKYKGVSWSRVAKKWHAYIKINRRCHHLGYFENEESAASAYNRAALESDSEFSLLNKIAA